MGRGGIRKGSEGRGSRLKRFDMKGKLGKGMKRNQLLSDS